MNFVTGLGLVAAGLGAIRRFTVEKGKVVEKQEMPSSQDVPFVGPVRLPDAPRRGGGSALTDYRMVGSQVFDRQEPARVTFRNFDDVLRDYLTNGPPTLVPEFEAIQSGLALPWWKMSDAEKKAFATARAQSDWTNFYAPLTSSIPNYRPPPEDTVVLVDNRGRVPSRGSVSREAKETRIVYDATKGQYVTVPAFRDPDAPLTQWKEKSRNLLSLLEAIEGQQKRYTAVLGMPYNPDTCPSEGEGKEICKGIEKLVSLKLKTEDELDALEHQINAVELAEITKDMLDRSKAQAATYEREGAVTVVFPGIIRLKRGTATRRSMTADQLRDAAKEASRLHYFRRIDLARPESGLPEGMELTKEARKAANKAREAFFKQQAFERRRSLAIAAGRAEPGKPRDEERRERAARRGAEVEESEAEELARMQRFMNRGGVKGFDEAAGLTAPNIAVVDGLGIAPEDAVIGIGSLLVLSIGAYTLYQLTQTTGVNK